MLADPLGLATVTDALAEVADGCDLVAGWTPAGSCSAARSPSRSASVCSRSAGRRAAAAGVGEYALEYGTATLEVPAEGIDLAGRSVR